MELYIIEGGKHGIRDYVAFGITIKFDRIALARRSWPLGAAKEGTHPVPSIPSFA
jgi:hypothetical protein